jgi:CheY-like chemotaxis protein/phosphoribosyl 1,2-cyclic phosphodiesterase
MHFGGNTSCVELRAPDGALFVFDFGTGARPLGADLVRRGGPIRAHLLIGHTHWDHIQGFPFFAPLFGSGNELAVYAPREGQRSLHDVLAGQMEFTYFPVELNQLPAVITYHDLSEGVHEIAGVRVVTKYLQHPAMTLGWRLEAAGRAVVYLVDHEPYSDVLWQRDAPVGRIESIVHDGDRRHATFMKGADLVIHDAQYTPEELQAKRTWGHSTYEYVVELAMAAGVKRVALTHHDPAHDDAMVSLIEQRAKALVTARGSAMDVFCAYEGCEVDVGEGGTLAPLAWEASPEGMAAANRSLRVLIADDDRDMRALAAVALKRDGHAVTEAADGREALRMITERKPDFLVLDLEMPEIGGFDVLRALRTQPSTAKLPVLILTARHDEESTRFGFELGATDYLTKPFTMPQLAARVRACMASAAHG